jgi:hypothetical protein
MEGGRGVGREIGRERRGNNLFGDTIRRSWVKRRGFRLRHFLHFAVQLRGGSLVQPGSFLQATRPDGVQEAKGTDSAGKGKAGTNDECGRKYGDAQR